MKIVYNNIIPFKGFAAINLFGVLFVRDGIIVTPPMLNHERIHTAQMREMLYLFFYLWYIIEWLIRIVFTFIRRDKPCIYSAYRNISFEREAYRFEKYDNYLEKRELFNWLELL